MKIRAANFKEKSISEKDLNDFLEYSKTIYGAYIQIELEKIPPQIFFKDGNTKKYLGFFDKLEGKIKVPISTTSAAYEVSLDFGWGVSIKTKYAKIDDVVSEEICSVRSIEDENEENVALGNLEIYSGNIEHNAEFALLLTKLTELGKGGHLLNLTYLMGANLVKRHRGNDWEAVIKGLVGYSEDFVESTSPIIIDVLYNYDVWNYIETAPEVIFGFPKKYLVEQLSKLPLNRALNEYFDVFRVANKQLDPYTREEILSLHDALSAVKRYQTGYLKIAPKIHQNPSHKSLGASRD